MRIKIEDARRALREGEFVAYFQPQVSLPTGLLAGFEVLARWKHPQRGMISPEIFIPCAESDGWIDELTQEIFSKAFTSARDLPESLLLSVNISPTQLRNGHLPAQIESLSVQAGFPLPRVIIEITETALAEDVEQALRVATDLKNRGCKLALDDFGTGYSSLRHLQSLPFDELKIDRSFVSSMAQKRESRKIVAALVGLGQSLGLTTVAEGVETREQADMLQWLGCDMAQGWLFGRPVPAERLAPEIAFRRRALAARSNFPSLIWSGGTLEGLPAQRLAYLQAIYDGAPVGLGFLNSNLRFLSVNQQLAEMNGVPVAGHLGRSAEEITPALFPSYAPYLHRALQGEAVSGCEIRKAAHGDQDEQTFLVSCQPARDEAGEVVGVSLAVLDFTARKKAEERLQQYERLVQGLEEMIVVVDREYRYVLGNRAFLDYRGMPQEDLIGRRMPDVVGADVFESAIKPKLQQCFSGKIVKYQLNLQYPRLGERELSVAYYPVKVSGGITGAACVLRDVTEMNRMARANQAWQKRFELAQRSGLRIGLWDWDIAANTMVWSDETYRQFGYTREEFSGRVEDALTRIHPEDLPKVQLAMDRVVTGKEHHYACQYRVMRPDGSTCWIDASGVFVRNGRTHMIGVDVDITALKCIEQSLKESEEKYLLLLSSTAQGIYGLDLDGNCTFCNPAGLRALGYPTQEELLGKNMHLTVHHSHQDGTPYAIETCEIFVAVRSGAGTHCKSEVMWRSDGTCFPVEYWSYPMFKDGRLVGAVVTFLPLSHRDANDGEASAAIGTGGRTARLSSSESRA